MSFFAPELAAKSRMVATTAAARPMIQESVYEPVRSYGAAMMMLQTARARLAKALTKPNTSL